MLADQHCSTYLLAKRFFQLQGDQQNPEPAAACTAQPAALSDETYARKVAEQLASKVLQDVAQPGDQLTEHHADVLSTALHGCATTSDLVQY